MQPEKKQSYREKPYFKVGVTALAVIFISILLVVIFTDLPGFFAVLKSIGKILSPLVSGCVFAFLLNPLVRFVDTRLCPWLEKRKRAKAASKLQPKKLSRAVSIVFALIFAALVFYAFFSMLLPQLYESVVGIINSAEDYYRSIESWVNRILADNPQIREYVDKGLDEVYAFLSNYVQTSLLPDMQKVISTVTTSVISVVKWLTNLLIGLVASVYILWSKDLFQAQAKKIIVALFREQTVNHLLYLGRETNKIFNGFVIGKIIDSAIIGVLCYIGMLILRLPYPALIATIVGVTNVIPFFGPIIGAVPSAFLILLVNPLQAFYFVIFVICLQQLDGNVIGPKILGDTVGISGFWVLISITLAASIFGFAGMLLGVPVFAVLYMLITDAVNLALSRKGKTTATKAYGPIQRVEDLQNASGTARNDEEDGDSACAEAASSDAADENAAPAPNDRVEETADDEV